MSKNARRLKLALVAAGAFVLLTGAAFVWLYLDDRRQGGVRPADQPAPIEEQADRRDRAQRAVESDGIIALAMSRFHLRLGRWPGALDELVSEPSNLPAWQHWGGPYIHNVQLLTDPWNRPYGYQCPGVNHPDTYDLWSTGPDGQPGTADDITNW